MSLGQRLVINQVLSAGDRDRQAIVFPPEGQRVFRKGEVTGGKIKGVVGLGVDFRRQGRGQHADHDQRAGPFPGDDRPVENRRPVSAGLEAAQLQLQGDHSGKLLRVGFIQPERKAKDLRHRERQRRVFAQPVVEGCRAGLHEFRGRLPVGGLPAKRPKLPRLRAGWAGQQQGAPSLGQGARRIGFYCSDHSKY